MIGAALATVLVGSGCSSVKSQLDATLTPKPTVITQEATVAAVGAIIHGAPVRGFPESLPMWPGAKVSVSKTTKTPQSKSYSATMSTKDPYADVLAGVGAGLKKAGFKVTATDGSTDTVKVTLLMISDSTLEGIVTLSQAAKKPVIIRYDVSPKK
jgi:hypothetical protein